MQNISIPSFSGIFAKTCDVHQNKKSSVFKKNKVWHRYEKKVNRRCRFQNLCRSHRRRRSLEQTRGWNWEELEARRESKARDLEWPAMGGGKTSLLHSKKKILHQENYLTEAEWREIGSSGDTLRNLKRKNKQLWKIHKFSEDWNKRIVLYRELKRS